MAISFTVRRNLLKAWNMRKIQPSRTVRPLVARDGSVYFIRRVAKSGGSKALYVPDRFAEALGWNEGTALMVWIQGHTLCVEEIEPPSTVTRLIPLPPRGQRLDTVTEDEDA
jgi:hypothetical protein